MYQLKFCSSITSFTPTLSEKKRINQMVYVREALKKSPTKFLKIASFLLGGGVKIKKILTF